MRWKPKIILRHGEKPKKSDLTSQVCDQPMRSRKTLKSHIESVHVVTDSSPSFPFKCDFCEKVFYRKKDKTIHQENFHTKVKRHGCQLCPKKFNTPTDVKRHATLKHRGQGEPSEHGDQQTPSQNEDEREDENEKVFSPTSKQLLDPDLRPAKCPFCPKRFSTNFNASYHVKSVHKNIKNFRCEVCLRGFSKKSVCQRHEKNVHKNIPLGLHVYVCRTCGDRCETANEYFIHTKKHPSLFTCVFCQKTFQNRRYFRKHVLTHEKSTTEKRKASSSAPKRSSKKLSLDESDSTPRTPPSPITEELFQEKKSRLESVIAKIRDISS